MINDTNDLLFGMKIVRNYNHFIYFYFIQVILYFKVYLMTCPAVLFPFLPCPSLFGPPIFVAWPHPINASRSAVG